MPLLGQIEQRRHTKHLQMLSKIKNILIFLTFFLIPAQCYAVFQPTILGLDRAVSVEEEDGSPSVLDVTKIKVSNGTLTDNLDTTISIPTNPFGTSIDDTEMTAEDFGDWTCTGLENGCTVDVDVINDLKIDWGTGANQVDVVDVENGAVNILLETEIDASSELLAIMDNETGTGALVFGTSPTFTTNIKLNGSISGTTALQASGVASGTLTLPATTGTIAITTGNNATGFFSSGTIEHERGGLEADVSAYNGLVKISGGVTSAITDSSTNWDTAYTHSQDNTQAHSDYITNNVADTMSASNAAGDILSITKSDANPTAGDVLSLIQVADDDLQGDFLSCYDNTLETVFFLNQDGAIGLKVEDTDLTNSIIIGSDVANDYKSIWYATGNIYASVGNVGYIGFYVTQDYQGTEYGKDHQGISFTADLSNSPSSIGATTDEAWGGKLIGSYTGTLNDTDNSINTYGLEATGTFTGATITNGATLTVYGVKTTATGITGVDTAYGIYATASGATTNYPGYFTDGTDTVIIQSGTNSRIDISDGTTTYSIDSNLGLIVPTDKAAFTAAVDNDAQMKFSSTGGGQYEFYDRTAGLIWALDAQTTDAGHLTMSNDSATSTNYYKLMTLDNGPSATINISIWIANNANPNTNLTGGIGDICFSTNGNAYRNTDGATAWSAM